MLFSIIIPIYNCELYLADCLISIDSQTYCDYEVIVVDDGSTDSSPLIAKSWIKDKPYANIVQQQNTGPLAARLTGVKHACGQYVLFVDGDDRLRRDALEKLSYSCKELGADLVGFAYSTVPSFGNQINPQTLDKQNSISLTTMKRALLRAEMNNIWGKAYRREIIVENISDVGLHLRYGEDCFYLLNVFDRIKCVTYIKESLYYYRIHSGSLTANYNTQQLDDIIYVTERVLERGKEWGLSTDAAIGVVSTYEYLLSRIAKSNIPRNMQILELAKLSRALVCLGKDLAYGLHHLRIDRQIEMRLLLSGKYRTTLIIKHLAMQLSSLLRKHVLRN